MRRFDRGTGLRRSWHLNATNRPAGDQTPCENNARPMNPSHEVRPNMAKAN
jgi:hypothetical protein